MTINITPGARSGSLTIPASKSQAHRLLICAAMGTRETVIACDGISRDIAATADCLKALGAGIEQRDSSFLVQPIQRLPHELCHLYCAESGATLRFLLPLAGVLGVDAVFHMEGRLPDRPLAPLDKQLSEHGMHLEKNGDQLLCGGQLKAGEYILPGNVSSQYISGLLMALPYLQEDSRIRITGSTESSAYLSITEDTLSHAGLRFTRDRDCYTIFGSQKAELPEQLCVEGDWSNAAFFLCMGALSDKGIRVRGLSLGSVQGDRAVLRLLQEFGAQVRTEWDGVFVSRGTLRGIRIDAAPIPDLIPVLSVLGSVAEGETEIVNAGRLRLKESDRLHTTTLLLRGLGADTEERDDSLLIRGKQGLRGGSVDAFGDHRIAMSAAAAACAATGPVAIGGAECVEKSYPRFWKDFGCLTGGE